MPEGDDPTLTPTQADGTIDMSGVGSEPIEVSTTTRPVAYQLDGLLGKGGMGEVWGANDDRLKRTVALKRMRTKAPSAEELSRFLREAKIQSRLDHPSIVPVYELGTDGEGFPYFTMKKLVGTTLAQLLATGNETQQRMLRALVDVCQALALAHSKGIVHRDIKPSNIMLGDYGEVYLIDWGVARILDEDEEAKPEEKVSLLSTARGQTRPGQLLGTPGYMAPEQIRGQTIAPPADVYALGSILFEILAGEPLHPRGSAALATTLDKHKTSPSSRGRSIPPELDDLCSEALVEEPDLRPTARELGDRIQQYLDGDRDVEHRRVMAAKLVVQGRAAFEEGERADAVRLGGRALALDPNNEDAAGLVMSLVTSVPTTIPAEVEEEIRTFEREAMSKRSRRALGPMLLFYFLTPFLSFLVVVNWLPLIGVYAAITFLSVLAFINWRIRHVPIALWALANLITCTLFTRLSGPFVLTPALICAVMMSASAIPWFNQRRWSIMVMAFVAVLVPFIFEEVGVFARSWEMTPGGIMSQGTIFLRRANVWPLLVSNLLIIVAVTAFSHAISRDRREAQRQLIIQTWHLRHLLPRNATERTIR